MQENRRFAPYISSLRLVAALRAARPLPSLLSIPPVAVAYTTDSLPVFYIASFLAQMISASALGAAAANKLKGRDQRWIIAARQTLYRGVAV